MLDPKGGSQRGKNALISRPYLARRIGKAPAVREVDVKRLKRPRLVHLAELFDRHGFYPIHLGLVGSTGPFAS